ncbi:shugoshin 1 isoform X2 [Cololabis saira]|uniref:shugoshin 1 isoform X2 n=1 Tax=Cololabis saira TaxID=129043 RepID=UPI002AD3500C|nr:shugoshin 1 isoform X2 [Cololabis saira]
MASKRGGKKSFQQSLEDIREKMKEKRTKRLSAATATNRMMKRSKSSVPHNVHTLLKGEQQNNKELALALQAEKERTRQANAVILHMKREHEALFLHFLLVKRKLRQHEALAASLQTKATDVFVEPQHHLDSARAKRTSEKLDEHVLCEASPTWADPFSFKENGQVRCDKKITLPPAVSVRRRQTDRRTRRQSERLRAAESLNEGDPCDIFGDIIRSPVDSDSREPNKAQCAETEIVAHTATEEPLHSTPDHVPPKRKRQQPSKKQGPQLPRPKPEPASQKPERGRKAERAPLKKPWENPKPRARSKSRNRSATRSKVAPPSSQGGKLNTSLGFNDTFDFDCEEAVHVTPFKAKVEDNTPTTPVSREVQEEVVPDVSKQEGSSCASPSSESEDSLYVPQKNTRRRRTPEKTRVIPTRRGRLSKVSRQKENIPSKQEFSVFKDEASTPKAAETKTCEDEAPHSRASSFSNTPDSIRLEEENLQAQMMELEEDVSPIKMMRIDKILSSLGHVPIEPTTVLPQQSPHRPKTCKKRGIGVRTAGRGLSLCDVNNLPPAAYRKFSRGGSRPSDVRCLTPIPARKRRCTMTVDYKEPSLNAKLRRGDKFTDVEFLCSPIFKKKPGKRSVQNSRTSLSKQQLFDKYNESFVGY